MHDSRRDSLRDSFFYAGSPVWRTELDINFDFRIFILDAELTFLILENTTLFKTPIASFFF